MAELVSLNKIFALCSFAGSRGAKEYNINHARLGWCVKGGEVKELSSLLLQAISKIQTSEMADRSNRVICIVKRA